jgi:hypothetical protein
MGENSVMDVTLLWFECKNPDCNYIPVKTKQDKIKRYWCHGQSVQDTKRPRMFMRYVEGYHRYLNSGDLIVFDCKYGTVNMFDRDTEHVNSYYYPIKDKELCAPCIEMLKNEGALFQ